MTREEQIKKLLKDPRQLLMKEPFKRGIERVAGFSVGMTTKANGLISAELPSFSYKVVTQEDFAKELDPASHKIIYDINVPCISMKVADDQGGGYVDIETKRMALPYQVGIKNAHVLHLSGNPTEFTLMETEPTERMAYNFVTFKQYWNSRNQDGMRTKFIDAQKSYGDAALLYYFDYKGRIKSRLLSYPNYVLIPINDSNGDRLIESIYYADEKGYERIDSYDDSNVYHFIKDEKVDRGNEKGWRLANVESHGFPEIPIVSKRGNVAWNEAQDIIEVYEIIFNIFNVIQKRHGWGILYIKGNFSERVQKLAGSVILSDNSIDGNGSAEFKAPPSPQGMRDTLEDLRNEIQIASQTTFILPKDVKTSGDISGIAIQMTQSMDNGRSLLSSIEWQNALDKMVRLFSFGLATELVRKGENPTAITEYESLKIKATIKVWMPKSIAEIVQMTTTLCGAKVISKETATSIIEGIGMATPDEDQRLKREAETEALLQKSLQSTNEEQTNNTEPQQQTE